MKTNRDLYERIADLVTQKENQQFPSLEQYLSNLLCLASHVAHKKALSLEEFFLLLSNSFDEPGDVSRTASGEDGDPRFYEWKAVVSSQIKDLQEMAENRQFENDYRYFGISTPSGRRWCNFDPCTYIECGAAGAFGGWEESDETEISYVPGPVACFDDKGPITACDPRELNHAPAPLPGITWEHFLKFVRCGQNYE